MGKQIILGAGLIVFVAVIALFVSVKDPANELRPQAVREMQQEIINQPQQAPPAMMEPKEIIDDIQLRPFQQPDVAGTTDHAQKQNLKPRINQVIEKEITEDGVKVNIQQEVKTTESVSNKINVKIDTKEDPPLVDINTETSTNTNCSSDTYNCSDFKTCLEAVNEYKLCPNDPNQLDPDQDGIPCDSLCS